MSDKYEIEAHEFLVGEGNETDWIYSYLLPIVMRAFRYHDERYPRKESGTRFYLKQTSNIPPSKEWDQANSAAEQRESLRFPIECMEGDQIVFIDGQLYLAVPIRNEVANG